MPLPLMLIAALLTPSPTHSRLPSPPHRLTAGQVTVTWQVDGDRLRCTLAAPTAGWVLMGVNTQAGLDGARLVFTRVRNGVVEAEVHRTDFTFPAPFHKRVTTLGGVEDIRDLKGEQRDGWTRTAFSIPRVPTGPSHVPLKAGETYHLILAWSVSDDFEHHSRERVSAKLSL